MLMKLAQENSKRLALLALLGLGFARAWIGRFSMNPDGISYLDLSDAFRRRDWHGFINAYWSPLYPMLLAITRTALPGGKREELIATHILNLLIYIAAVVGFEFFYVSLVRSGDTETPLSNADCCELPPWALWTLAHSLFLWGSLDLVTVWGVTPDLCVSAFVYVIAGLLLRLRRHPNGGVAVVLGLVLGASYWAKAVMFPLAFATMAIALFSVRGWRQAVRIGATMALSFGLVAGPLVVTLSRQKHRLTFGDSGRINYSVFVSPGGVARNWQGEPSLGITAVHPTHKILSEPPVYEFAQPVGGTFPPFYDPSYWQEGRVARFNWKSQAAIVFYHLLYYLDLFLHRENAIVASFVGLALVTRKKLFRDYFPVFAMCGSALGLYMLVHVETRFVSVYIVVLWIALFGSLRVPSTMVRFAGYLLLGVSMALLIAVVRNTGTAIRDYGPYSALQDVELSDQLDELGVHAGDRIAIMGDGGIYAARLSHVKIIAELMDRDSPEFWRLDAVGKQRLYQTFAQCGVQFLLASDPGPAVTVDTGWTKGKGVPYYLRKLGY